VLRAVRDMIWGRSIELCFGDVYRLERRVDAAYWTDAPGKYEDGAAFTTCVHAACVQTSSPSSETADLRVV